MAQDYGVWRTNFGSTSATQGEQAAAASVVSRDAEQSAPGDDLQHGNILTSLQADFAQDALPSVDFMATSVSCFQRSIAPPTSRPSIALTSESQSNHSIQQFDRTLVEPRWHDDALAYLTFGLAIGGLEPASYDVHLDEMHVADKESDEPTTFSLDQALASFGCQLL